MAFRACASTLEAIGESDGDPAGVEPGGEFFSDKFEPRALAVLDALMS